MSTTRDQCLHCGHRHDYAGSLCKACGKNPFESMIKVGEYSVKVYTSRLDSYSDQYLAMAGHLALNRVDWWPAGMCCPGATMEEAIQKAVADAARAGKQHYQPGIARVPQYSTWTLTGFLLKQLDKEIQEEINQAMKHHPALSERVTRLHDALTRAGEL